MIELATEFALLAKEELPLPGHGRTRQRWRWLAEVAGRDLALAKLAESHHDAVAIVTELGAADLLAPGQRWAVWAAEPPTARVTVSAAHRLTGRKAWCSGADQVSHALITAWTDSGEPQLCAVDLREAGIGCDPSAWAAVGMGRALTPDLSFDAVAAEPVGRCGQYTSRPGFWHGGAGIAACWFGGLLALAEAVYAAKPEPHRDAHLGAIDVAISQLRALLIETAAAIDADPADPHQAAVLRVRAAAEAAAELVLQRTGHALGAGPLCRDATVAEHFADLPVFIRQTHAERDLAGLAELVRAGERQWLL